MSSGLLPRLKLVLSAAPRALRDASHQTCAFLFKPPNDVPSSAIPKLARRRCLTLSCRSYRSLLISLNFCARTEICVRSESEAVGIGMCLIYCVFNRYCHLSLRKRNGCAVLLIKNHDVQELSTPSRKVCDSPPLSDSGGGINYAAIAGTYSASNWLGDL